MGVTMRAKLGRCKSAARGALQLAAQRPAYAVQILGNIGRCMQRCRALQGAALQPLFIGLQRCSAAAAKATGRQPSVMGDDADVANLTAAAGLAPSAAWRLCTSASPSLSAAIGPSAPAAPGIKNNAIRATPRLQSAGACLQLAPLGCVSSLLGSCGLPLGLPCGLPRPPLAGGALSLFVGGRH